MAFTKGALILIDYTAKVKDSNEVVETTIVDDAKKHNLFQENVKYQPKLVSVGESWVLKGLDDALANAKAGDKLTVDVTPDKGFGERDPGKVRCHDFSRANMDAQSRFAACSFADQSWFVVHGQTQTLRTLHAPAAHQWQLKHDNNPRFEAIP